MVRWIALPTVVFLALLSPKSRAMDAVDDSFTPLYEGAHVISTQRLPSLPPKIPWGSAFMRDTDIVLGRYKWYVADVTCLVEASGQVRETIITESMPTLNLSAAIVDDLRTQKLIAGIGPEGPVASLFSFRIYYTLKQYLGDLGTLAGRLRRSAQQGNAGAQYTLSRLMGANVALNRTGLDADDLLRRAADPGKDRRAMLALGAMTGKIPAEERRGWVMKSARADLAPAQVLVALDSWAEQTEAGHARARHWLELAAKAGDPVASKYLAALLVSHSDSPADWKVARKLASTAGEGWHGRNDPDAWQVLAAAAALTGDFAAAVKAQSKARDLAADAKWTLSPVERRLTSYEESRTVSDEIVLIPVVARVIIP